MEIYRLIGLPRRKYLRDSRINLAVTGLKSQTKSNINPYMPSGLFHHYKLDDSICHLRGSWSIFSSIFTLF